MEKGHEHIAPYRRWPLQRSCLQLTSCSTMPCTLNGLCMSACSWNSVGDIIPALISCDKTSSFQPPPPGCSSNTLVKGAFLKASFRYPDDCNYFRSIFSDGLKLIRPREIFLVDSPIAGSQWEPRASYSANPRKTRFALHRCSSGANDSHRQCQEPNTHLRSCTGPKG